MLPTSSGRLVPVIVTVVPPSTGPPVGVNCAKSHIHLYIIYILCSRNNLYSSIVLYIVLYMSSAVFPAQHCDMCFTCV